MRLSIKYSTVFSSLMLFLFFFPISYATRTTVLLKYIAICIAGIITIAKGRQHYFTACCKFYYLCICYFIYILIISAANHLEYANLENVFSVIIFAVALVFFVTSLRRDEESFINAVHFVFAVYIIWDLMTLVMFPDGIPGKESIYGAQFLFGNKNNHTMQLLVYLFSAVWKCKFDRKWDKLTLILSVSISFATIILLGSSTTTVSIGIAIIGVILFWVGVDKASINSGIVVAGGLGMTILILLGQATFLAPIVNRFGKDMTFTTRTDIWVKAIPKIAEKPILGWGNIAGDEATELLGSINTHNQLLDSMLSGGLVLLTILLMVLFMIAKSANRIYDKNMKSTVNFFLIALLIKMMFEQIASASIAWFFFMLLYEYSMVQNRTYIRRSNIDKG